MNFTHRKILFSILFKLFIHFLGNKYLLEKEKQKIDSKLILFFSPAGKTARPTLLARALCFPGRNLGLGRQSRAAAHARLGRSLARSICTVHLNPTATRAFRSK